MANIPNPTSALHSKTAIGISDCSYSSSILKFMGATVVSASVSVGWNGTASSCQVTLVEDLGAGDAFVTPTIPSIKAFSLLKGGVGVPIIYSSPPTTQPSDFNNSNVPFYFCGICTGYQQIKRDTSGKTYTVTLTDPREIFSGIQLITGGWSLSQSLGGVTPRITATVDNIIDCWDYFSHGYEADYNPYGMKFNDILTAVEACRVKVHDMNIEFYFTNTPFIDTPDYYRISDQTIDLLALLQKVCQDSGSDYICIARKITSTSMVVEIRGIRRTDDDLLTKTELDTFVNDRTSIVENYKLGREYRNEFTSSIILGGMRNANYVAWPSEYDSSMHLTSGKEDYNKFPSDIKVRLFGGDAIIFTDDSDGEPLTSGTVSFDIDSGAILPFWGFTTDDNQYPLIEPFLPLDHLVFDRDTEYYAQLTSRVPICRIRTQNYTVREVSHEDVFLNGDGNSDSRPFAYVEPVYTFNSSKPIGSGYIRGLPLNTEVLRASLGSTEAFWGIYWLYYPDIAESLGASIPNWRGYYEAVSGVIASSGIPDSYAWFPFPAIQHNILEINSKQNLTRDSEGKITVNSFNNANNSIRYDSQILEKFQHILHDHVRQYALDHMGKKFLVCLPRSEIMNRIWDGDSVPTNPNKPEIEYVIDNRGYWEYVPSEFDGIGKGSGVVENENQIRRKFMAEDGRFYPMVGIDWKPTGNICFNSNGINRVMFQDFPVSEFRPNRIAEGNPDYVFVSCSVNQLSKRPDLALVELPSAITFDPTEESQYLDKYESNIDDEFLARKFGIIKYLWNHVKKNNDLREGLKLSADANSETFTYHASSVISAWADKMIMALSNPFTREMSTEFVMDLKVAIIPLTSTWVSYGPYYATYSQAKGMRKIEIDESLVPWNFDRSDPWYSNLDAAGAERLARTIADLEYVDNASIVVAGFPEYGPGDHLGFNSNLTGINVDFGIGGIKTTYNFSTYAARPGTYRKSDYDNISTTRTDTREQLPDPLNLNILNDSFPTDYGKNRFRY